MQTLGSSSEKKSFYRMVLMLTLPIMGQNLISLAVDMADVLMLGYVSQTALSASSLANQIRFILGIAFFGFASGTTTLVAQYWGKNDRDTIEQVLGFALRYACVVALLFTLATSLMPHALMRIFTTQADLIDTGATYLRILGISFVLSAISLMYTCVQSGIERVMLCTRIYCISLVVNVVLNAVFIFGLLGAPKLGIVGVAVATVIARGVEVALCLYDSIKKSPVRLRIARVLSRHPLLMRDFWHFTLPALGNDLVWGVAFALYSVILGHLGSDIIAANALATVAQKFARVACFGISTATAIVLGKAMGKNDMAAAELYGKRMYHLSIYTALVGGALILLFHPLLTRYGNLTDQARHYYSVLLYISSYYVLGQAINTTLICGVFRSGGDARFGFFCDLVTMWCWAVPVGFLCAFILKLPVLWVYFILCLDEFVKLPVVIGHYHKKRWLRNITRDTLVY